MGTIDYKKAYAKIPQVATAYPNYVEFLLVFFSLYVMTQSKGITLPDDTTIGVMEEAEGYKHCGELQLVLTTCFITK